VFGPMEALVETGGDGVGEGDLAVVILEDVRIGALKDAWRSSAKTRRMLAKRGATASGFHTDEGGRLCRG